MFAPQILAQAYEKDSLGWQLHLLGRRLGEWWERQLAAFFANLHYSPPELSWLNSPLSEAIARAVFWGVVGLLCGWLLWQFWRLAGVYYPNLRNQLSQSPLQATQVAPKDLSAAGWVARSQRALERQDYREACLCLYLAMLQQLQETNLVPQLASRTDGEYLELLRQFPQFPAYQTLLIAHQQLYFGNRAADPSLFSQCDNAYQIISQHRAP